MTQDEQHLNLLSIFHYIVGGFAVLFSCIFLIYVGIGIVMLLGMFDSKNAPPPFMAWFFLLFGSMFMIAGWTLAGFIFAVGRKLKRRVSWMFCLVVAGVECIFSPFGTILGVFTIFILMKDSVKELFGVKKSI
ncbi:MAG: hypothetical protein QME64_07825 [bacterium]|nr:hypothetical protein [bacterium]